MSGHTDGQGHEICIKQRREVSVTGVRDIDSFDETGAVLQTVGGELVLEGEGLKIGILDTDKGVVTITGKINGFYYSSEHTEQKRGIISRIFK